MDDDDPRLLASQVHRALVERGLTIASAESLTGGALGDLLSDAPGSSDSYVGGVISYATEVKQGLLGVRDATVADHGVVSAACAAEMAAGVRRLLDADVGVSTTGVAGPTRQEGKPVGLVFVGIAGHDDVTATELQLTGGRAEIRLETCRRALQGVLSALDSGALDAR